ncbi:hypothetical protein HDU96_007368 [Phlyctochytrium bullatum]|nr:hypothetical protein HDU96_007368 [Phlyctochytrium bullatum]
MKESDAGSEASNAFKSQTAVCTEVLMKRLRAFRKRLTKIERAEAMNPSELNKDQRESLQRKPEVVAVIRELEEITKHLTITEQEELKSTAEKEKERIEAEERKVAVAVDAAKTQADAALRTSLQLLFALNSRLPKISSMSVSLSDNQFAALTSLSQILNGAYNSTNSADESLAQSEEILKLYLAKSNSEFAHGVTYAELESLVAVLLSPPKPPVFGSLEEETATEDVVSKPLLKKEATRREAIPLHMISFINPSEVL